MKKTSQRKMLEVLYDSGFHFEVKESEFIITNPAKPKELIKFIFDKDEDLNEITGYLND